jgi:hypothetical protein
MRVGARSWPGGLGAWAAALFVFVVSWPVASLEPVLDLDQSFRTGLHMATYQGLHFGPDILFTYGPLGFLHHPVLAYPWTTRLAFAYSALEHFALAGALVWALRRHWALPLAVPLAVLLAAMPFQEPMPIVAFIGAVALLTRAPVLPAPHRWLALAGALAGLELLAKLNTGVTMALLGLVLVAVWPDRRRAAAWFAGGFVGAVAIGWLLTGQPITGFPRYVSGSLEVVSGYSEAMVLVNPEGEWELWVAGALAALGIAFAWWSAPPGDLRRRLGLVALWLVVTLTAYKSGFVRHSAGHTSVFFSTMVCCLPAFARPPQGRLVLALALGVAVTAQFGSLDWGPRNYVQPVARTKALAHEARLLLPGGGLRDRIAAARRRVLGPFGIDQGTFDAVGTATVHVDPYDTLVAWAAQLRWRPEPVYQSYSAYTEALDRDNASFLLGARAPERIIRHVATPVDFRNPAWDSPAEKLAMLCRYRPLHTAGGWQVLGVGENRCGAAREIGRVHTTWGRPVAIPPAPDSRSVVAMRLDGAGVHGLEKLRALAYRAVTRSLSYGDGRSFRLVPGTTANEMVLRVPKAADFPAPFALDQGAGSFTVARGGGAQPGGRITVRFYAVPIG